MTRPDDELTDAASRLRTTTTRLSRLLRRQSPAGLSPSQLSALGTVARSGPLPIGALADEEAIAAPTATKVVDKLAAAALVERRPDPSDRRVSLVAVTDQGRDLLDDIGARRTAWLTERLRDLPEDEYRALHRSIEVLEHLVQAGVAEAADRPEDLRPAISSPTATEAPA